MGCIAQLADCYEFGTGVVKDLHQALDLYQRCMEGGFDAVKPAILRIKQELGGSDVP
jgi:TPR repeat protein